MALVSADESQVVPQRVPGVQMLATPGAAAAAVTSAPTVAPKPAPVPTPTYSSAPSPNSVAPSRGPVLGGRKKGRTRYAPPAELGDFSDRPGRSMAPAVWLCFLSALFAGVVAYGTHPYWAQYRYGLDFILLSRKVQWPFTVMSLVAALALVATVISGRRRVFWLIGLGPILALFGHRFATDPNATMRSVENPAFVAADAAGEFLADGDYVVGLTFEGKHYAYPYAALYGTPVVIHADHDKRVLVMWSAPANRAVAVTINREVRARDLDVVSTPANALLVYDTVRGVFINGLTGKTMKGEKPAGFGTPVPTVKTEWRRWRAARPDTEVMTPVGPLAAKGPKQPLSPSFPMPPGQPLKHPADAKVVLVGSDRPTAVQSDTLAAQPVNLTADGVAMLAFRDPETGAAKGFRRRVDDLTPRFRANKDAGRAGVLFVDADTNSGWNAAGVAVDAKKDFKGKKLAAVPVEDELYWGVMKYWYPELELVNGDGAPLKLIEINGNPAAAVQPHLQAPQQGGPGTAVPPKPSGSGTVTVRPARPAIRPSKAKSSTAAD